MVVGAGILWWRSTPEYCLREAGKSFYSHDHSRFNEVVNVTGLVMSFTEEIIFAPARTTPGLTKLQRVVGLGVLESTRTKLDNTLVYQVQNIVKYDSIHPPATDSSVNAGVNPSADSGAAAGTNAAVPPSPGGNHESGLDTTVANSVAAGRAEIGFARAFALELDAEKQKLKQVAFDKMLEFARQNPETIVHKIFYAQENKTGFGMKQILQNYGFRKQNYRGYKIKRGKVDCVCTLRFFSPKINDEIHVRLELERPQREIFTPYRISKFVDLKSTFKELGEDTDSQVQGLIAYGLEDVNKQSIKEEARSILLEVGRRLGGQK